MYDPTGTVREFKERLQQELQRREQWVVRTMQKSTLQQGLGIVSRVRTRLFGQSPLDVGTQVRIVAWDGWPADAVHLVGQPPHALRIPFNGATGEWLAQSFAGALNSTTRQYAPVPGTTDALGLVVRQPAEELLLVPLRWPRLVETVGEGAIALRELQLEDRLWEWIRA